MKQINTTRRSFLGKTTAIIAGSALLSSQFAFGNILADSPPFEGYNPYAENTNDLRKGFYNSDNVKVSGTVFAKDGLSGVPHAKIEVWHLSPGIKKFRHHAKFYADEAGNYSFLTDFPDRTEGKKPRIFFKISKDDKSEFSELLMDHHMAHINEIHWAKHEILGDRRYPTFHKNLQGKEIQFNITL